MSNWAKLQGKLKQEAEKRPRPASQSEKPLKRGKVDKDVSERNVIEELLKVKIPQKVKDKYVGLDCEMVQIIFLCFS